MSALSGVGIGQSILGAFEQGGLEDALSRDRIVDTLMHNFQFIFCHAQQHFGQRALLGNKHPGGEIPEEVLQAYRDVDTIKKLEKLVRLAERAYSRNPAAITARQLATHVENYANAVGKLAQSLYVKGLSASSSGAAQAPLDHRR
ncbi:MAG: hypothetical protein R3C68_13550 [Myxococcota bacterium]